MELTFCVYDIADDLERLDRSGDRSDGSYSGSVLFIAYIIYILPTLLQSHHPKSTQTAFDQPSIGGIPQINIRVDIDFNYIEIPLSFLDVNS